MGFKIVINKKDDGASVVSLIGSLDSDTCVEFENNMKSILESASQGIILDMKELSYISSLGFGAIFRLKQALEKNESTLALVNLQPSVKKIFDALKAIPEALFATIDGADKYLDAYVAYISKKVAEDDQEGK
ncbi:MAG: STAS domain-containing protein [Candidatus Omnitrophica bacterium]|nr:STAS domain-containing protein [Candidatus Omnitrophota bacterium]